MKHPRKAPWPLLALALLAWNQPVRADFWLREATLWFRADITVGPEGRVTDLEWRNFKPMPGPALRSLERVVPTWQFRPDVPMASEQEVETTLLVQVVAKKRKDGRFGLRVEQALTGPSLLDVPDERGWQRWERIDQGYRPASTEIVYDVAWGATGMQSIELVEFKATSARPEYRKEHEERARGEIGAWLVKQERVDGQVVVDARFRFLYAHCVIPAWCASNKPRALRGLPAVPPGEPVPVSSVLSLQTRVRGLVL